MREAAIWWEQIGSSLRMLDQTAAAVCADRSALLHAPGGLPWPGAFREALELRRTRLGCGRRLTQAAWRPCADPGAFLLETLCGPVTAARYWPCQSYGSYLGGAPVPELRRCCVWGTGIQEKADLMAWDRFLRDYESGPLAPADRAVFLLEYRGGLPERPGLSPIESPIRSHDLRVFCMELASELGNTDLPDYQAELAQRIGGSDVEYSAALLRQGPLLLTDPVTAAHAARGQRSDGTPFRIPEPHQVLGAARKADMALLFPILEQARLDFIAAHESALRCRLPTTNSAGETVTDPFGLELGPLHHLTDAMQAQLPAADLETVRLCHRVRNLVAHNKPIPGSDLRRVLALRSDSGGIL